MPDRRPIWPLTAVRIALALALLPAPAPAAPDAPKPGDVVVVQRTARTPDGRTVHYELGTFHVPENRDTPNSRPIGVGFARMRAAAPVGGPPIFLLPGGPGASLLTNFTDEDPGSRQRLANFVAYYGGVGDLVVMDQRGYSKGGDVLEFTTPARPLDRPRSLEEETSILKAAAAVAVATHPDKDLAGYTIEQCAHDVNDLRRALGYEKIILSGQSFGSQWSFAVMRLHPEIVLRAQLSGVEPLDDAYDMPSHVLAAIRRIARDADRDSGLAPYMPKGGLMRAIGDVRDRLAARPVTVGVGADRVTLGVEDFREALLMPARSLPGFVLALYHERYDDWARQVLAERRDVTTPTPLIGPLIDTGLGVTAERERLLRADTGVGLMGTGSFAPYIGSASAWPTPDAGDALRRAVRSPIPVLFIHGDWDTSTPVENTLGILSYFPNARAIVVHRGTHGARKELFDLHPEVLVKMIAFLKTGEMRDLPASVELPAPAFEKPGFAPPRR